MAAVARMLLRLPSELLMSSFFGCSSFQQPPRPDSPPQSFANHSTAHNALRSPCIIQRLSSKDVRRHAVVINCSVGWLAGTPDAHPTVAIEKSGRRATTPFSTSIDTPIGLVISRSSTDPSLFEESGRPPAQVPTSIATFGRGSVPVACTYKNIHRRHHPDQGKEGGGLAHMSPMIAIEPMGGPWSRLQFQSSTTSLPADLAPAQ
jgi:hypothetical protein